MKSRPVVIVTVISLVAALLSLGLAGAVMGAGAPEINNISPTNHAAGAFPVILSGSNFTGVNEVNIYNAVTFYEYYHNAPFSVDSDGQITVNANLAVNFPEGTFYFEAISPDGISNNSPTLTVTGASGLPVIDSISPTNHVAGTFPVILTGQNFAEVYNVTVYNAQSGLKFYDNAHFNIDSDSQITVNGDLLINFPGGTFNFVVTNLSGVSNHSPTLTVPIGAPVITEINPANHAAGNFQVTLTGANFYTVDSHNVVIYDAATDTPIGVSWIAIVNSDTRITVSANFPVGSYYFTVTNPAGTSNHSPILTVSAAPAAPEITGISPTRHVAGTFSVLLTGSNFTGLTNIFYTGPTISNTSATLDSDSQITLSGTFPAGSYAFQVVTPNGASNYSPSLTVTVANTTAAISLLLE